MKGLAAIMSIVGFYLAYWIFKSIFHSFLDDSTTLDFVIRGEWIIAGVIGVIICLINSHNNENVSTISGCIITGSTFIAILIPFSIGLAVLYNIIVIGSILYSIFGKD